MALTPLSTALSYNVKESDKRKLPDLLLCPDQCQNVL